MLASTTSLHEEGEERAFAGGPQDLIEEDW
jgi:hypothetical protein